MFKRFTGILNSAVEALAPNAPLQDGFIFHWKAVTNFFMENRDAKSPIEETNIPNHLQNMVDILLHEEAQDDSGSTGPCMEYLLHHKLLETLYTIGRADCPPGMKQRVLLFFKDLLSKIKQPLLPHVNVFKAVHKLIRVCGEVKASPTEVEEMQFLCTVCSKLKAHPHVVNFFLEEAKATSQKLGQGDANQLEFGLVDALLSMSHSADSRVAVKCCEGLILLTSLPEEAAAKAVINNTKFLHEIATWLNTAYTNLPRNIDPARVDAVEARWGMDHMKISESAFPGQRHIVNFLSLFDYCNILIKEAHPLIAQHLVITIRRQFLEPALTPDLLKDSEEHFMAATAYLCKALQFVDTDLLNEGFSDYIFEVDMEPSLRTLSRTLIERCDDPSETVGSLNLKLFDLLLQKPAELTVMELFAKYLVPRGYYDESRLPEDSKKETTEPTKVSTPSTPVSPGSDLEAEYAKLFNTEEDDSEQSMSAGSIADYYINLLPESIKSSYQLADSGYDIYLNDAHKQFAAMNLLCSSWVWPVAPQPLTSSTEFFEGYFLRILFGRVAQMTEQSYSTNLLLTSIISKVALLPHKHIHEYMLNPFIPLRDGVTNLRTAFKELLELVTVHCKNCKNINQKLIKKRNLLMGVFGGDFSDITVDEDRFLGAIIVLEEFCKELAAISFAKHHILM
ncbi:FHF complex subunit HOOK interacting protein 2A-like isoform X2 [Watersipora subatra]|uniref:FHF complex subunit HOOK interacting protein 2A-like isoform X2 n=1 Tax=Watersipora subatra TaxID=2589382 RepID=UPI00355B41EA